MKWKGRIFGEADTSHDNIGRKNAACEIAEIAMEKSYLEIHRFMLTNVKMKLFCLFEF